MVAAALLVLAVPVTDRSAAVSAQEPRQQSRIVSGRLIDSVTGQPIVGAWAGFGITGTTGAFPLATRSSGTSHVQVRCPLKRRPFGGRTILLTFEASPETRAPLVFRLSMSECVEPELREIAGEFAGSYTMGFEHSVFIPCEPLPTFPGTGYDGIAPSVTVQYSKRAQEQRFQWRDGAPTGTSPRFVRWIGRLTGPGGYGHNNLALYQLEVDSIISSERGDNSLCREHRQ